MQKPERILVFGDDGARMKDLCQRLRLEGFQAQARSIRFFQGCFERCDKVYFLERADRIRALYDAQKIPCYLIPEAGEAEEGENSTADNGADGDSPSSVEDAAGATDADPPQTGAMTDADAADSEGTAETLGEAPSETPADAKARRQSPKKGR